MNMGRFWRLGFAQTILIDLFHLYMVKKTTTNGRVYSDYNNTITNDPPHMNDFLLNAPSGHSFSLPYKTM